MEGLRLVFAMEFGSVIFLLRFLPIFFICYYLVPGRMKNFILLLGSLCFYAWGKPLYVLPMVVSAGSDFFHGIMIEKYGKKGTAKVFAVSATLFDLALLFVFGYADFFIDTINLFWGGNWAKFGFSMPFGITIYTLQSLSYVFDVYRGKYPAARNLLDYAAYVTMFPQLSAGPIVRFPDVKDSLQLRKPNLRQSSYGAKRVCVGLAKIVLISDAAGRLWETILGIGAANLSAATAWLGVFTYAFQVYYRFSGCADVAIGLGACMGFAFPENFDHPFVATSIRDFVKRWNLSLTKWMKEYFYGPLAGGSKNPFLQIFLLMVTFGLIGLWYGPDWTFVLWGLWIGLFYVVEKLFLGKILAVLPRVVGWCYAMLVVSAGWLLLAMNDAENILVYLRALIGADGRRIADQRFFFLALENLPMLVLGFFFAHPLFSGLLKKLDAGRSGASIAATRLLEKIYPPVFLLASLVYLVGRGW